MKILMICTEKLPLPPIRGGAIQTYIAGALPYLKEDHDITVLGVNDPDLPDDDFIDGVRYVRIPGKLFEVYKEGVVHFVESEEFDLIHIFNRPRLVMPVRSVAPHSTLTLSMHNDMFKLEKIEPAEAEQAIEEVSRIVTVSDYIGNVIKSQYPQAESKLQTIYSGVDVDRFLPGNDSRIKNRRESLRREHGLENKTVLLFAGRLSRNKGVDRLIRALPELSKRHKDLALVIVGSNWFSQNNVTDYVAYVRALAKKLTIPVVQTGFVSPFEIQNWFAAADLFVCTSVWQEPLARVHYEAMAAALPIVTTNRGGNAEVIELEENGLLVEHPEDPNEFVEALDYLLSNRSVMRRMGQRGRELALTKYTWDRVASDILDAWAIANETSRSVENQPVSLIEEFNDSEAALAEEPYDHVDLMEEVDEALLEPDLSLPVSTGPQFNDEMEELVSFDRNRSRHRIDDEQNDQLEFQDSDWEDHEVEEETAFVSFADDGVYEEEQAIEQESESYKVYSEDDEDFWEELETFLYEDEEDDLTKRRTNRSEPLLLGKSNGASRRANTQPKTRTESVEESRQFEKVPLRQVAVTRSRKDSSTSGTSRYLLRSDLVALRH
ncbi:glycosyltransferase family 4 protein [Pullulanibacillus sp. KACC 23026]|uniref:glycosyltransferase family 4 protein n=1 Tax=Pullulanibacillus sp. KACC 23026 TaxID=3028315 RepID=UPI0023AF84F3|nr:glycosyltransferase family 4 protein [Pullulanibacillus sp. KACC 23026]WEG13569.1 glycosyltransferase family 4 protein [Pullulanibacillus sp. KACC 23026]